MGVAADGCGCGFGVVRGVAADAWVEPMNSSTQRLRKRRTKPGTPKTFVIEVGPITPYDFTDAEIARMERKLLREMDERIRSYWQVGKRSKVVRSRIEEVDA